jgi:hypothetical protein
MDANEEWIKGMGEETGNKNRYITIESEWYNQIFWHSYKMMNFLNPNEGCNGSTLKIGSD